MRLVGDESESALILRAAFDSSSEAMLVMSQEGTVVAANQAFRDLWHLPEELVAGGSDDEVRAYIVDQVADPGFRRDATRTLGPYEARRDSVELKDGRTIERMTRPIEYGAASGRLWTFRDVTGARRSEAANQRERALASAVVQGSPDLIWLKDPNGVYLACNPAFERLYGASEKAIVGKTDYDFVSTEEANFFRQKDREAIVAGRPVANEEWLTFAVDGRRALVETIKTPIRDERGAVIGVLGTARDITERAAAEAAYRGLFDGVSDAIFVQARDGRFLDVNIAAERLHGFTRETLIGATPATVAAPGMNDLAQVARSIALAFEGEPQQFEFWGRRSGGEHFLEELRLVRGAYRGQDVVIATARDITERKRREQALIESEASFRAIFDGVSDAIFIHDAVTGAIIDVNPKMAEMYGIEREDAPRYGPDDLSAGAPPFSTAEAFGFIQRALAGETPIFEWLARRPRDGSLFWVEVNMRRAEIAGKTRVLVNVRDIGERKRADEALAKSRADQRAILDNFPFMVWLKDLAGRYVAVNEPFVVWCGVPEADVIGKDDLELWSRDLALKYRQDDAEVIATRRRKNVEELLPNDGPPEWVETYKAPLFDADGTVRGTAGFARNITDRKRDEERLRAMLAEKEALLREIHHRVKNNLSVIISLIGLQSAEIKDPVVTARLRELSERARTMALVHESLYRTPNLSAVDFGAYLQLLGTRIVSAVALSPLISVVVECKDVRLHIEQAVPCGLLVHELLSNALKYAFPPARLADLERPCVARVALVHLGDELILTVSDNGVGIPATVELDSAQTLGLQLVSVLASQLGGVLELTREGGTTYRLAFRERL